MGTCHRPFFQAMEDIGLATSGMLGARLGDRLGMPVSWMTILRRVMARPCASVKQVVELAIDDFSFRRGRRFGTILVDLQSQHVIDLLPDRSVETVSAWMHAHPEIKLVSRDRGGDYAAYASAPQAVQCADRFHLLANLGQALEGRHLAAYRNRHSPQAVLRGVLAHTLKFSTLARIFFATEFTHHLDRSGYIRFRRWRFYAEAGLAKTGHSGEHLHQHAQD